jgi:hypothetical protein
MFATVLKLYMYTYACLSNLAYDYYHQGLEHHIIDAECSCSGQENVHICSIESSNQHCMDSSWLAIL